MTLKLKPFENIEKGENADSIYLNVFHPFQEFLFLSNVYFANAFNLDQSRICRLVKS